MIEPLKVCSHCGWTVFAIKASERLEIQQAAIQSFAKSLTEGGMFSIGFGEICTFVGCGHPKSDCAICPIRQRAGLKEVSNGD